MTVMTQTTIMVIQVVIAFTHHKNTLKLRSKRGIHLKKERESMKKMKIKRRRNLQINKILLNRLLTRMTNLKKKIIKKTLHNNKNKRKKRRKSRKKRSNLKSASMKRRSSTSVAIKASNTIIFNSLPEEMWLLMKKMSRCLMLEPFIIITALMIITWLTSFSNRRSLLSKLLKSFSKVNYSSKLVKKRSC